jgi:hypothetical protein
MNNTARNVTILAASAGAGIGIAHLLTHGYRQHSRNVAYRSNDAAETENVNHLLMALLGGGLVYYGLRRRDVIGAGAVTLGVNMMRKSHPLLDQLAQTPLVAQMIPRLGNQ